MNSIKQDIHPKVFISYSHDSPKHADHVLALSDRLRADGVDCILDQYETSPPEGWTGWMDRNIRDACFVLMVCTQRYYRCVMLDEKLGTGLGVKWEGKLIYQHIYQADSLNTKFIPVLFDYCNAEHIPTPLQDATRYCVDTEQGYKDLYRRLTNQPRVEKPKLGKLKTLESRKRHFAFPARVSTAKLPSTSPDLFGREGELKLLDKAWQNKKTNILSFVAFGGVGKTALVNYWLNHNMAGDNFRGAERVFGWSFYSQGAKEDKQASADVFIDSALRFFGDPETADSKLSGWEKGARLAENVRKQKTLLILDGLEPLQSPHPPVGQIKDDGLASLLRNLAVQNPGLCIVTTRLKVDDLKDFFDTTVKSVELEDLSVAAGIELLKNAGVEGTDDELKKAVKEYKGHALALTLLGSYLKIAHDGDIRKRDKIPHLTDEQRQGAHARRVMACYESWFKGKPELNVLYIIGLFDRPAEAGAVDVLKAKPAIKGLTDELTSLSDADYKFALSNLREVCLLAPEDRNSPGTLDAHPLVREYFGEKLQSTNPKAWKEAHNRLYEYYKALPEKELPDTIEEMTPLFLAVAHGCQAGRHQEVYREVYRPRIQRGNEYFSTDKLGAFGADLAALAGFFETPWNQPVSDLRDAGKAFVLNEAGFDLRALGRLEEAVQPFKAGLDMDIEAEDWRNAAPAAGNLSQLYLALGNLSSATDYGQQSVKYADRSGDAFQRMSKRTTLAGALHQAGEFPEAEELFREAEEIQEKRQPYYPLLYSLQGFGYCDLLLGQGKYQEVLRRAKKMFEWRLESDSLLDIGLDNLSLGRAYLLQAQIEKTNDFTVAAEQLNQAVDGLRKAGTLDHLPRGLLARAELYRVTEDFNSAQRDLDEAFALASRCGMKLHETDCCLEYARLYLAEGEKEKARENFAKAEALVKETGYRRRGRELSELERELA